MESKYELMVHYYQGVNPLTLVERFLSVWNKSLRLPFIIQPSTNGVDLSDYLREKMQFNRGQYVSLTLKNSNKRKESDVVEFYFTNPTWKLMQTNYCTISFPRAKIDTEQKGYLLNDIIDLLAFLVDDSYIRTAFFELTDINYHEEIVQIERRISQKRGDSNWPVLINLLTYIPHSAVQTLGGTDVVKNAGLEVQTSVDGKGIIVWSKDKPSCGEAEHIQRIKGIMKCLCIL